MAVSSRKKIVLAAVVIIAVGVFLPPNINGARFKSRLAAALTAAVGRPVNIGSVSFRLLPRPGFDLYNFEVADDAAFNAEPLLRCGKVTADLRLTSLWQGRLEIANLKLQTGSDTPPSLNLVYLDGHWNVESLFVRAEQVPTAPTSKKRAEQRARFPYIEADGGRINIKIGAEKKPYALINTDFAFWLPSEDQWHLRLQGHPVRTDMNLSDTGTIRIEGDLKRSPDFRQTPVNLSVSWDEGQLGQLSKLAVGHDKGWRGGLYMKIEVAGALGDVHLTAEANLQNFRRYDIDRSGMFDINARCLGRSSQAVLDFNCSVPVQSGGIRVSGKLLPMSPGNYDLSLVANRLPLSAIARFATYAKRSLPEDLTATGQLDAAFAFHSHGNLPPDWHGAGSTSAFLVSSSLVTNPIQVSSIHFRLNTLEKTKEAAPPARKRKSVKQIPVVEGQALTFDPFSVQLGANASLQAQGSFRSTDYLIAATGTGSVQRILELGNVTGFRSRITNVSGTAELDVNIHGQWANFAPARLGGTAHLDNVTATVSGVKSRLLFHNADVHFSDSDIVLVSTVQFEHSPVEVIGSVSKPLNCQSAPACALQFDLHADSLAINDIASLLGSSNTGWRIPFISRADKLPDFRAGGTLTLATLNIGELSLEKFIAHLDFGEHTLAITKINAGMADGSMQANWGIDWGGSPVRYSGSGTITGVSPEHVPLPPSVASLLASWINGKTNLTYSLDLSGQDAAETFASAHGRGEFVIPNGMSHTLTLEGAKPIRFQAFQGTCEINHGVLELLPSKFKAENRIYEISGTISLADKQAKLKVSNSATQWEITGALEKPHVAAQRLTAQVPAETQ